MPLNLYSSEYNQDPKRPHCMELVLNGQMQAVESAVGVCTAYMRACRVSNSPLSFHAVTLLYVYKKY